MNEGGKSDGCIDGTYYLAINEQLMKISSDINKIADDIQRLQEYQCFWSKQLGENCKIVRKFAALLSFLGQKLGDDDD